MKTHPYFRLLPVNLTVLFMFISLLLITGAASAAAYPKATVDFATFYNLVFNWATGYLGRSIAIGAFLIGCVIGIMGKPVVALTGVGIAIILTVGPSITDGIFAALI